MKAIALRQKKKLEDDVQNLERSIGILKLYLLECNITLNEGNHT